MHALLEKIFETKLLETTEHQMVQVHSETSREQCAFLQKIIADNQFSQSIEIGFAYGISALAITESVAKNNGSHTVIDKFEISGWKGIGLELIKKAGYSDKFDFHEAYSYEVLPKLLEQGKKFDFAYIDTTKLLDFLMVDFFFLDKLLETNGVIIFDDVLFSSIRKLMRYISQLPNYKIYRTYPANEPETKRRQRFIDILKKLPYSERFLNESILKTDFEMGINSNCIALQKTGDDTRNWDWHKDF